MTIGNQPEEIRAVRGPDNGAFGTLCPVCGVGRLSCPAAKTNSDKSITVRERLCDGCGVRVVDTVLKRREVHDKAGATL